WAEWAGPQQAAARAREEAERIASTLMARGRLTLEEAMTLRQEITGSVHKIVGEAQRGLEGRLHKLVEPAAREGGVGGSLTGLRERLMAFETYLAAPTARARKPTAARARRRS